MTVLVMSSIFIHAQKKYDISSSGCSVSMYCQPGFQSDVDQDSNPYYSARCAKDDISYGIVCIKLSKVITNLKAAEDVMIQYIEYLKADYEIMQVKGYEKGIKLKNREDTRGLIDHWTDNKDNKWKIKAYTDGKFIGILYAFSRKELPEEKVNAYLDSFRLPGME